MSRAAGTALAAALTLLVLVTAGGCADDPNAAGTQLLPDSLDMVTLTTLATSDTNYLLRIGGNQTRLLTGRAAGFEARALVRFSFPSFNTLSRIDSAFITITPDYFVPDSGGPAAFTVHRMTSTWASSTFRWDSVAGSYDTAASGAFSRSVGSADSAIRVRIDTALARTWLTASSGSMMLVPASGGTTVVGFQSHIGPTPVLRPTLDVYYHAAGDTGAADTTKRITRIATDGVFVADGPVPAVNGVAMIQSGIAWRELLRFDSLSLPAGAAIAQAVLELTPAAGLPPGPGHQRDSLAISFVQDAQFPLDTLSLGGLCIPVTDAGGKIYRGDVKSYVQLWNSREPNRGIVVRGLGEFTTLDQLGIFGPSAADSLRPRLRITYTRFP